ncbi:MAG: hypothetical protein KDB26_06405 [Microthrixaceae bacterium]|nr:hypothetical protein [Microthrixaceae bacterium]
MTGKPTTRVPRTVTACLTFAVLRHLWAAASSIGSVGVIGPIDWVVLAAAEVLLLSVALHAPSMFQVRRLRLVGVATAANSLLILAPLPDVIPTYNELVPRAMIFSLAAAVAAMALVFLTLSKWSTRDLSVRIPQVGRSERLLPTAIVVLTIVVLPLWFVSSGLPPLFNLLTGTSSNDLAADRQAAFSQLGSAPLRLVLGILRNLLIMFAGGWFAASAVSVPRDEWRRRSTSEIGAMLVAGLGVFFALLTTERAVVGELLVVCGIAVLLAKGQELSAKVVGALVAVAAAFPVAVGILSGAGSLIEVLIGLRRRIFHLPAEVMTRYFIEFPRYHEHLHGASIPKLSYLTGGETFDLSQYIYLRYYQRSGNIVGNANGSFLGVGWANFGFLGVVLWALAAAVTLVVLDRAIDQLPLASRSALRGLGVIMAVLTTSSDIFRNILSFLPGFLDLVIVVWLIARLNERRAFGHEPAPPLTSNPEQDLRVRLRAPSD